MANKTKTLNEYKTSDFGLAVALSFFFPLIRVEKDPKRPERKNFIFSHSSELDTKEAEYWSRELKMAAIDYYNASRTLKNRLYA